MIGVINKHIIKLDADYCYPIHISGMLRGQDKRGYNISVAGIACRLSKKECYDLLQKKLFKGLKMKCDILAFSNLVFGLKHYDLRVVKEEGMDRKLTEGDKDSDFDINQVLVGEVVGFISNKNIGEEHLLNLIIDNVQALQGECLLRAVRTYLLMELVQK